MGISYNPRTITDGLVLCLDAANPKSYPGSGTTWTDLSGNGNNGTLVNGVGYNSGNGGSLVFDGTDDIVNSTSISSQFTADMTAEAWVYLSSYDVAEFVRIVGTGGNGGNRTFGLWYSGQRLLWQRQVAGVNQNLFPETLFLSIETWYHIAATTSGSSQVIYLNGSSVATNTFSGPWGASGENITIGFAGFRDHHDGRISNIKIYNRALTATEIQQNFIATRSRFGI